MNRVFKYKRKKGPVVSKKITYDKGSEFMADFAKMIVDEYGIKKSGISPRNPQANSILERIHQVIGNMIKTFQIYDREDTIQSLFNWKPILSFIRFPYSCLML